MDFIVASFVGSLIFCILPISFLIFLPALLIGLLVIAIWMKVKPYTAAPTLLIFGSVFMALFAAVILFRVDFRCNRPIEMDFTSVKEQLARLYSGAEKPVNANETHQ